LNILFNPLEATTGIIQSLQLVALQTNKQTRIRCFILYMYILSYSLNSMKI